MDLKNKYKDSPYVIQLRAPILMRINLITFILLLLLSINAYIGGRYGNVVILMSAFIVTATSIFFLRKGNYPVAANFALGAFTGTIVLVNIIMGYNQPSDFLHVALMGGIPISFSFGFSASRKSFVVLTIVVAINYFVLVVRGAISVGLKSIGGYIVEPFILLMFICMILILASNITTKVTVEAKKRYKESKSNEKRITALASEATEKLSLAQSMEDQASSTVESSEKIESDTKEIQSKVQDLVTNFDKSIESLKQIENKMNELDGVADDQSANVIETSASLEEMVASIKNVSHVIEGKMESVKQLRTTAGDGAATISETATSFEQVLEHLDSIKQMVTLISGISSQTNLLAMNAAIEAAHAGEAGRGFAVVADEVRKLAESSSKNAKVVSDTLKLLVVSIEETGGNVKKSGNSFSSIESEVSLVNQAMEEINLSIKELATGSDEILVATSAMNALTGQVSDTVQRTKSLERDTFKHVESLGGFINSLEGSMGQINSGSKLIRNTSEELRDKCNGINRFVKDFSAKLISN